MNEVPWVPVHLRISCIRECNPERLHAGDVEEEILVARAVRFHHSVVNVLV